MPPRFQSVSQRLLHEKAAEVVTGMIDAGEISDVLPPERVLAERLGISRPVLRQTLASLDRQGIIEIAHGRRTRILTAKRSRAPSPRTVLIAGPTASSFRTGGVHLLDGLRRRLEARGFTWTEYFDPRLRFSRAAALLSERTAHTTPSCLLLVHSTEILQRWAQETAHRAVVFGTTYPGIHIPSIDIDYHAVGWHAAGQFLKAGHRRIGLVLPQESRRGDQASRDGLMAYLHAQSHLQASVNCISAGSRTQEVEAALERVMARKSAPTAFFTFLPFHTLTMITFLLRRGIRIPEDVTIISRESEACLEAVLPEPARYERNTRAFVTQASRLIEKISARIKPPTIHVRLMPTFHPGATIGPAPSPGHPATRDTKSPRRAR